MTRARRKDAQRTQRPTIIVARGNDIRYVTVRPWLAVLGGGTVALLAAAYMGATAYLVMRDDLIGAAIAQQARLQHAYEDRIAALRAQVDRITSQQMLEQQRMQRKMGELVARQERLSERHGRLAATLERADEATGGQPIPVPTPRPDQRAALDGLRRLDNTVTGSVHAYAGEEAPPESGMDRLFAAVDRSLRDIETEQVARVETLAEKAYQTAESIVEALGSAGIPVAEGFGEENVGGPLIPLDADTHFEEKVRELDEVLERLEALRQTARRAPVANPLPGAAITSPFGTRRDPILRRPAHHSGIDFRARHGTPIRASGAGTVIHAGWNGGYGRMVEIDHGNGITTRYAHLSKVSVSVGEEVSTGTVIGSAGSSGRSTGPHLHYEVRRDGEAINPMKFISAGRQIADYL